MSRADQPPAPLDSRGFPVSGASLNSPEALEVLLSAFSALGISFDPSVSADPELYRKLCSLAVWSYAPPDDLRFQDPEARRKVDLVRTLAAELRLAVIDVWEYVDLEPSAHKVNICDLMFTDEADAGAYAYDLSTLEWRADLALAQGLKPGKGRPPLLFFSVLVRGLNEIYIAKTGRKGFSERGTSAEGDFVDLVFLAQGILPAELQHSDKNTIGNRVLAAFGGKSSKKKI